MAESVSTSSAPQLGSAARVRHTGSSRLEAQRRRRRRSDGDVAVKVAAVDGTCRLCCECALASCVGVGCACACASGVRDAWGVVAPAVRASACANLAEIGPKLVKLNPTPAEPSQTWVEVDPRLVESTAQIGRNQPKLRLSQAIVDQAHCTFRCNRVEFGRIQPEFGRNTSFLKYRRGHPGHSAPLRSRTQPQRGIRLNTQKDSTQLGASPERRALRTMAIDAAWSAIASGVSGHGPTTAAFRTRVRIPLAGGSRRVHFEVLWRIVSVCVSLSLAPLVRRSKHSTQRFAPNKLQTKSPTQSRQMSNKIEFAAIF